MICSGRVGEAEIGARLRRQQRGREVEAILVRLIGAGAGTPLSIPAAGIRPTKPMKRFGRHHGIPGQAAMELIMAGGLGSC